MTYDAAGRPVSTTSAYGTVDAVTQSVTYGANGQVASLTDGQGNVSVMEYNGFNRPSKLRYPNATGGGTSTTDYEQVNYDAYGRVSGARNRAGDTTYFGYDLLNRTIAVNAPGSTPDISSAYDNLGRMTVTGNGTITVVTGWDALSRPVSEASSAIGAMTYAYDEAGRMTKMTWPDGFAANYSHDLYGATTAISQQPSGGAAAQVAAYGWNDLGQPTSVSRAGGAGASTTYGYDAWGRMSSLAHDASGSTNDVTLGFSYNPAGQIAGRTVSNPSYIYGASATGATAYQVDGQNQLDTINGAAVTHDSRGNVTGVSGNTYGYDDLNRPTSASAGAGSATFAFDPMNRLATSTVGGVSTRRQYAGDQLVAEYNPATGAMTKRYIPGLGLDNVAVAYDGSGTSTRNWQLADERGSVIALSGSTGAVSDINTYDEYGIPGSGNVGRFQYTGQQWLPEAGAYHYRARTYLPQVGRFLQTDPIGYSAGANLYGYVGADPMNWTDPLGFDRKWIVCYEGGVDNRGRPVTVTATGIGQCVTHETRTVFNGAVPSGGIFGWSGRGAGGSGGGGSSAPSTQPQNTCPSGPRLTFGGGPSGTLFGGVIGGSLGLTGNISVPLSSLRNFSLEGIQFSVTTSATGLAGFGGYVGAGQNYSLGITNETLDYGFSTSSNHVIQAGAGWVGGVETSAMIGGPDYNYGGSIGGRNAYGVYGAAGKQFNATIATHPLGCTP
jgi:RHS repeat-associated protein